MVSVVLSATILAAASLFGFVLVPWLSRNRVLHSASFAFSAGTLLTVILMHLLPEAIRETHHAPALFVLGFIGMLLLHQHVLQADPCCGHEHAAHAGWPSYLAMALCSFNDGIITGADAEHGLASPVLWVMVVHKITSSFALVTLLRSLGNARASMSGVVSMTLFSLITPATLLAATWLVPVQSYTGYVMAASAGALLYVIAGSMVPRVEHFAREGRSTVIGAFLAAVALTAGFEMLSGGCTHVHGSH